MLDALRARALDSLIEMGRWRSHCDDPLAILGRIAGIDETRLLDLIAKGEKEEVFRAVRP